MEFSQAARDRRTYTLIRAFELEEAGDIEGAIANFKEASRQGSVDARSKLGTIYDDVIKPPRPEEAVRWYRKGASAGDAGCAWNLAMHYAGIGNVRWYKYWLHKAKELGDPDAREELNTGKWWKKRNDVV